MAYDKLKGRMVEKKVTQGEMAKRLNVNISTLNAKLNKKREFTINEVITVCEILEITNPNDYFFVI
jgi:putative phage repressor